MITQLPVLPDEQRRIDRSRAVVVAHLEATGTARRHPRGIALAAAVAAAAGIVVGLPSLSTPTARALEASRQNGVLVLRIADAGAGADELTRELREAGVRGEVRTVAVPESLVGTWAAVAEVAAPALGTAPQVVRLDRIVSNGDEVEVPLDEVRDATGSFVFYAGRPPHPGEAIGFDGRRFLHGAGPSDGR